MQISGAARLRGGIQLKKAWFRITTVVLALAMGAAVLTGCGGSKDLLSQIKDKKVLVIGTSADYEPYEYYNDQQQIVGFDIDIANRIASDLGVTLKIEEMGFDGLLTALTTGKIDMIIAGMNPTDERKKTVDFTDTYYTATQNVLIRAADIDKFTTVESFKGVTVSVQKGSTQEEIATKQLTGATIESLEKVPDEVLNLQFKKSDAVVLEGPVAKNYAAANPDLAVANFTFPDEGTKGSAIAVRKGNESFLNALNDSIRKMQSDGTMDAFIQKAFAGK